MEGGARVHRRVVHFVLNLNITAMTPAAATLRRNVYQLAANQKPKNTADIIKGDSGARLHAEHAAVWWKPSAHNLKNNCSFFQSSSLHISLYGHLFQAPGPAP